MKHYQLGHRFLTVAMAAAMMTGILPVSAEMAQETTELPFQETDVAIAAGMSYADESEEALHNDNDVVRVSIILEQESTISRYAIEGIAENASAKAYRAQVQKEQEALAEKISTEVLGGAKLDVVASVSLIANLISANVAYGDIEAIKAVSGVKDVVLETYYEAPVTEENVAEPNTSNSGSMIGSVVAYANGYTGAGARIAIIDTGTDTDHQSFDAGAWEYSLAEQAKLQGMELDEFLASIDLLDVEEIESVLDQLNVTTSRYSPNVEAEELYLNGKLAFAYNYVDRKLDVTHDNDGQGEHGSHVAGIATANKYIPDGKGGYVNALTNVYAQGVAPDAQLLTMKVFGARGGAYDSDYFLAIEDAIILKADTINLSLGSASPGFSQQTNATYQSIYEALKASGSIATISAGNEGSWAESGFTDMELPYIHDINFHHGGSPGSYTDSTTVASIDNVGFTGNYFTTNGENTYFYNESLYSNEPMTSIAGEYEYIFVDNSTTVEDWDALGDEIKGRIAICGRGGGFLNLSQKSDQAVEHGAIATIIHYDGEGSMTMNLGTYHYTNPSVSITRAEGYAIRDAGEQRYTEDGVSYHVGTIAIASELRSDPGNEDASPSSGYKMSEFTSWGTTGALELKPDITAPGGNIWSVNGAIASGDAYENMSGTSMAAPHLAGMGALVGQRIRKDGLEEKTGLSGHTLKNALLTSTSVPVFEDQDGVDYYYSILRQGTGLANVGAATSAKSLILMNEDANSGALAGKVKAEVGDDPEKTGVYSFGFSIVNLSDEDLSYTFGTDMFTQDVLEYNGTRYLNTWTRPLEAIATYVVDGEEFKPTSKVDGDVTMDGVTNVDDAIAILKVLANNDDASKYDWAAADVDGDGEVSTYDAHLILVSSDEDVITVKANDSVEVEVKVAYTDETKAMLDEEYPRGAYVEGFTYVRPVNKMDDAESDVEYSIAIYGFYGDYTDPNMFEEATYIDSLYGEVRQPYSMASVSSNVNSVRLNNGSNYYHTINPYAVEDTKPVGKDAINPNATISNVYRAMIRQAGQTLIYLEKEDGEVLKEQSVRNTNAAYYSSSSGRWSGTTSNTNFNARLSDYVLSEGETVTLHVVALPEYFINQYGLLDAEDAQWMIENGWIGQGALQAYSFKVDGTEPVAKSIVKANKVDVLTGEAHNTIDITAGDDNYVAYIALYSNVDGAGYQRVAGVVPEGTEAGKDVFVSIDIDDLTLSDTCLVLVGDYAMNQKVYEVKLGGDPESAVGEIQVREPENAAVEELEKEASGTLHVYSATSISTDPEKDEKNHQVRVNINAKNDTNGLLKVKYDASVLTLKNVTAWESYSECNADEDGTVLFGFASKDAVKDTVASLDFTFEDADNNRTTVVTIEKYEENNTRPQSKEELSIRLGGVKRSVTIQASEHGTVDPEGTFDARLGDEITVVATPDEHYVVDTASVNGEEVEVQDNAFTFVVDANMKANVTFKLTEYAVTASAGENGTISPACKSVYTALDEATYTITPDEHYEIESITLNGEPIEAVNGTVAFTVDSDKELNATFKKIQYTVIAKAGKNGVISPEGEQIVASGDDVVFTLEPDEGYLVEAVLVNGKFVAVVDNTFTVTILGNTSVKAFFTNDAKPVEPEKANVKLVKEGIGNATLSQEGQVETGSVITLEYSEDIAQGYVLDYIKVNGEKADPANGRLSIAIEGDTSVNVVFRQLHIEFYNEYWYENGVIQGTVDDPQGVKDTQYNQTVRGREIYDPATEKWYWLDSVLGGKPAKNKEVWMPYVYQDEKPGSTDGKWVRYDANGGMIKGWYSNENGTYYYDMITGAMAKGTVIIDGKEYIFDTVTGILQ